MAWHQPSQAVKKQKVHTKLSTLQICNGSETHIICHVTNQSELSDVK